jgi:hypothetical protein
MFGRIFGVGISAEGADRLFTAFYTTKPDGMGMGLSTCRSIIDAHGGRLCASRGVFSFSFRSPLPEPPSVIAVACWQHKSRYRPNVSVQTRLERGSRGGQRPASASTRKRASVSLNKAGSSRLRMWPVLANILGEHHQAGRRNSLFQEQIRLDADVVLIAGNDGARGALSVAPITLAPSAEHFGSDIIQLNVNQNNQH